MADDFINLDARGHGEKHPMNPGASQLAGASDFTAEERRESADPGWYVFIKIYGKLLKDLNDAFILFACFYSHARYNSFFAFIKTVFIRVKSV